MLTFNNHFILVPVSIMGIIGFTVSLIKPLLSIIIKMVTETRSICKILKLKGEDKWELNFKIITKF